MRPVVALAAKDLRLLLRQKSDLFFAFGFPVLMAVFFGLVFSGEGGQADPLKIAVHDADGSEESRAFVDALAKAPEVDVLRVESREGTCKWRTRRDSNSRPLPSEGNALSS